MAAKQPYVTIRARQPADGNSMSSGDSAYASGSGDDNKVAPYATHDISRVQYHVKHLPEFARSLEESAARAFPNRGRFQRYQKVQSLLLHWKSDDLFVLPELEDLEQCLREDYSFSTETFAIPSDNSHLELMLRIAQMIKEHENNDTLFIVYYGGHARIDESRQSTWCATRNSDSPWLQWSAIQTLLERSLSDVLILLDCCAGAASATFPNGNSITETISASSWDAIAPDPGRYSFTNALIEVLQEWKNRTFSAAMLHAEVLARLKHPRPIMLNGKHFEARSTPVHFMMTSNHRAPSIELARILSDDQRPPSPPQESEPAAEASGRAAGAQEIVGSNPNEDVPHVMISLALEDDQRLNVNDWENWLSTIPAIAKYVKVQGVFKSHSTLLLLSMPVMVWDMLPDNHAASFIAFIRSNNLAIGNNAEQSAAEEELAVGPDLEAELRSIYSGTTAYTGAGTHSYRNSLARASDRPPRIVEQYSTEHLLGSTTSLGRQESFPSKSAMGGKYAANTLRDRWPGYGPTSSGFSPVKQSPSPSVLSRTRSSDAISRQMILNQARSSKKTFLLSSDDLPDRPELAPHVQARLEEYFQDDPTPTLAVKEFLASNLGIETTDIDLWSFHRRHQQEVNYHLQNLRINDQRSELPRDEPRMMLAGHLDRLLEIFTPNQLLVIDLRSPSDFAKSHIYGAVNIRSPASFIQAATFELIENALADDESRATFNKWYSSPCIAFYDRNVEFAWECPTAKALIQKFKTRGWTGHSFILKGNYREFSVSFDKYIVGQKMTDSAKEYLASLGKKSLEKKRDVQEQYNELLRQMAHESNSQSVDLPPSAEAERKTTMNQHQKDLEDEFERRLPSLYRKAMDLEPEETNWDRKMPLVGPLSRGLEKMAEAGRSGSASEEAVPEYPGLPDKLRAEQQHASPDDYDFVSDDDDDLALQKAGHKLSEDSTGPASVETQKKGRGRHLLKMLRSGK